jgi:hypothetical protein
MFEGNDCANKGGAYGYVRNDRQKAGSAFPHRAVQRQNHNLPVGWVDGDRPRSIRATKQDEHSGTVDDHDRTVCTDSQGRTAVDHVALFHLRGRLILSGGY